MVYDSDLSAVHMIVIAFVALTVDLLDLHVVVDLQFADRLFLVTRDNRFGDPVMDVDHQFHPGKVLEKIVPAHIDPERLDGHIEEFFRDRLDDAVLCGPGDGDMKFLSVAKVLFEVSPASPDTFFVPCLFKGY